MADENERESRRVESEEEREQRVRAQAAIETLTVARLHHDPLDGVAELEEIAGALVEGWAPESWPVLFQLSDLPAPPPPEVDLGQLGFTAWYVASVRAAFELLFFLPESASAFELHVPFDHRIPYMLELQFRWHARTPNSRFDLEQWITAVRPSVVLRCAELLTERSRGGDGTLAAAVAAYRTRVPEFDCYCESAEHAVEF